MTSGDEPDVVKVFNLLKGLHDLAGREGAKKPGLVSIGERAEEIARAFEDRQKTTRETLDELDKLVKEVAAAEAKQAETSLSPEGFAVYWLLQKDRPEQALGVAQAVEAAFKESPHWMA